MSLPFQSIQQNWHEVQDRIHAAARRAGRDPAIVRVIAVTKGHGPEAAECAFRLGLRDLGENRIQEALGKQQAIARGPDGAIRWHLLGPLQSNKLTKAALNFDYLHALSSRGNVAGLDAARQKLVPGARRLPVFVQVNLSGEATKSGCREAEALELVECALASRSLKPEGLMTIAPLGPAEAARPVFSALRVLRDSIQSRLGAGLTLSMGMSQDYEVAIEEGADWIRLGTALFGERS